MKNKLLYIFTVALIVGVTSPAASQQPQQINVIEIDPLFVYPEAPQDLESITDRSNWLLEHFWDPMNFKKNGVSQVALDHAFSVYTAPMLFADKSVAETSIQNLIKNLKNNPTLLYQFTKAAENNLYSPASEILSDEAYVIFLEKVLKEKKFPKNKKGYYQKQLKAVKANLIGNTIPKFNYTLRTGNKATFKPTGTPTLLMIVPADCDDCRMLKIQLDLNKPLEALAKEGHANIYHLTTTEPSDAWKTDVADYPEHWIVGASPSLDEVLDVRLVPCFMVIDGNGTLIFKNGTLDQAILTVIGMCAENSKNTEPKTSKE